jgi:hypothetical protein
MELKIHKSVFGGKILSQLKPHDMFSIEGWQLTGDFSLDGDDYYYFIFERDIDPGDCFDPMEDQHVWEGGKFCKCGKKDWSQQDG